MECGLPGEECFHEPKKQPQNKHGLSVMEGGNRCKKFTLRWLLGTSVEISRGFIDSDLHPGEQSHLKIIHVDLRVETMGGRGLGIITCFRSPCSAHARSTQMS